MKRILIQPGHINIQFNCKEKYRSSTGAPNEQEFTLRIANRVSELLRERNFEVKQTDANANCDPAATSIDWDYALAIHGDADVYGTGGGLVDFPDPAVDQASAKSETLCNALREEYFKNSEIVEHPERSNKNTRFYYLWSALSPATPCVLIECGVLADAHDKVILTDTERVSTAIVRGICKGLNEPYDLPVTPPVLPANEKETYEKKIEELGKIIETLEEKTKTQVDDLNKKNTQIDQLLLEQQNVLKRVAFLEGENKNIDEQNVQALRIALDRIGEERKKQHNQRIDNLLNDFYIFWGDIKKIIKKNKEEGTEFSPGILHPELSMKNSEWFWKQFMFGLLIFFMLSGLVVLVNFR